MDDPASKGRRRRRWLIAWGILVVVLGGVTWVVIDRLRTETTPVSIDQAIAEFQPPRTPASTSSVVASTTSAGEPATTSGSTSPPTTTVVGVAALPQPGVYRFATSGGEDLSILNNPSRTYPVETPVIIEPQGCGVVVRWTPLEERTETWEMFLEDGGVRLAGYTSVHSFSISGRSGSWCVIPAPGSYRRPRLMTSRRRRARAAG